MKSSIGSRSLKLLNLATQVGRKELTQSIKDQFKRGVEEIASGRAKTRIDQARLIVEHLAQLKGAAMKAGQLLSLDASDFFPPEAVEMLSKLQGQADPVEWSVIHKVLLEDLGADKLKDFTNLSERATASASIGQVHRATLQTPGGPRDVAIKIQYPGVADSIDSDLAILRTLAQSFVSLSGRKMDLGELFAELAVVLKQEADYKRERENMEEFRKLIEGHPEFAIPFSYPEYCRGRVLTMSWQEGQSLNDWLKSEPSKADREKVSRLALELYCLEFFAWGFVQTDPNYGNFLIRREGSDIKLVLLDFGAALHYTPEFRRDYVELLNTLSSLDRQKIVRKFVDFGLIDPRESEETFELFAELLVTSLEPFQPASQPFRFRDDDFARRSREIGRTFTQALRFSPPPRKVLFLHRKLGGIFALLKKLDVQLDLTPYWDRMTGTKVQTEG